jgi:2-(1,2-epoxy-1,2-dihydrophenyl)acetyl-CoA isomerase
MTTFEDIRVERTGAILWVTLNRPSVLNALSIQTANELLRVLRSAENDAVFKVCVIRGVGRAFSAGFDLKLVRSDGDPELGKALEDYFNPIVRLMRKSRIIFVTALNGIAAGSGAGIALAGDIILAARSASIYQPFVKLGLVPDVGNTFFLPRIVGRCRAAGLMLLAEKLSASDAAACGLIWKCVEDEALDREVSAVVATLETHSAAALAGIKRAIEASFENTLDSQLDLERDLQDDLGRTEEYRAAVKAFVRK